MTWHKKRFEYSAKKIRLDCAVCGVAMYFPPSKYGKYFTCGSECKQAWLEQQKQNRTRACEMCGADFVPRQYQLSVGQGRFCSTQCALPYVVYCAHTESSTKKRTNTLRESIRCGRVIRSRGPENPHWKGGPKETLRRQVESGKCAKWLREYRKKNPEKVREWAQARRGHGRLPKGFINKLMTLQRRRCAICEERLTKGFHVDHVTPLKRGGKHEPHNIQLLCGTCNVRKSDKDPIKYMQEQGRLL